MEQQQPVTVQAIVTVDIIVVRLLNQGPELLLIQRGGNPFKDYWALPGGQLADEDVSLEAAALRELREETGLVLPPSLKLKQMQTFGNRGRDPRPGRWVSVVFYAPIIPASRWQQLNEIRAGDDASDARWFAVSSLPEMAFDHRAIAEQAFSYRFLNIDRPFRYAGWPSHLRG